MPEHVVAPARSLPIVSSIIAVTAFVVIAYLAHAVAARPLYGARIGVILLGLLPAALAVNRGSAVLQKLVTPHASLWRGLRFVKWFGLFLAPVLFGALIEFLAYQSAIHILAKDLQPLAAYLEKRPAAQIEGDRIIQHLNGCKHVREVTCAIGTGRFLLTCPVSAIDIDGYTFFFDSRAKSWQRYHNDMLRYNSRIGKMESLNAAAKRYLTLSDGLPFRIGPFQRWHGKKWVLTNNPVEMDLIPTNGLKGH